MAGSLLGVGKTVLTAISVYDPSPPEFQYPATILSKSRTASVVNPASSNTCLFCRKI
jgi:hypothetical protein